MIYDEILEPVETIGKTLAAAQDVASRAGYGDPIRSHWDGKLWVLRFMVPVSIDNQAAA